MAKMLDRIGASIFGRLQSMYYRHRYESFRKQYNIKSNFGFNGEDIRIYGPGSISLGDNSYIGSYSTMQLAENTSITIGRNCLISHNVRMYTQTDLADQDFNEHPHQSWSGNITIGDAVWIGANVFIGPGITIGDNAVVGANSVVTKDVQANSIVGGVPAKLLRYKNKS